MAKTASTPAPATDLASIIQALKEQHERTQQQAAYYAAEAERLKTALSVLEEGFALTSTAASTPAVNGRMAQKQVQSGSQPAESVLNQPSTKPASKSTKRAAKAKAAEAEESEVSTEAAPAKSSKQQAQSGETFSLKGNLRPRYSTLGLDEAIVHILKLAPAPMQASELVDELYGKNMKRVLRPRAIRILTRHLNQGVKDGRWQQGSPEEEGAPPEYTVKS
jgi:hypothetical protein